MKIRRDKMSSFIIVSDVIYKQKSVVYSVLRNGGCLSRIRVFSIPYGEKTCKENASIYWEHLKYSLSDTVCVPADKGLKRREGGGRGRETGNM
jgi:hypothetical protein